VVETGGLENRLALTGYGGSNPSPSAIRFEPIFGRGHSGEMPSIYGQFIRLSHHGVTRGLSVLCFSCQAQSFSRWETQRYRRFLSGSENSLSASTSAAIRPAPAVKKWVKSIALASLLSFTSTFVAVSLKIMAAARYVVYYRVSTAKQGRSGLGLEAQRGAVGPT
jgi:hypothetical protein